MRIKNLRTFSGKFLVLTIFINSCLGFLITPANVTAQTKPIIITADQPNLWTLEQAHYLLAQMHRRNLDLKAKGVGALDANEINGVRFDVLKQLIEIGAAYDQAAGFNNNLIAGDKTFNSERRHQLVSRRDRLQDESLDLTRALARLNRQLARAGSEEEKERIDAEIDEKTAVQAAIDKQITHTDNELKNLPAASGDLKSVQAGGAFDPTKFSGGALDGAFKKATEDALKEFSSSPQLNASLRLENYLQMQYEIISKQLTLLRDEVGPGERLVFLELPQSISTSFDKADQKWAQSWWRIVGYTRNVPSSKEALASTSETEDNQKPITTSERLDTILGKNNNRQEVKTRDSGSTEEFINLSDVINPLRGLENLNIEDRRVRTVELIPRQSSVNINDVKLRTTAGAVNIVASFLFGFGAKLNAQRQREQFSQFVQQELYSSAFGKGSPEFGWTFTPMPGTNRLISGVRTTYAVVVVPQEATSLVLQTTGCYFPRSAHQPNSFRDAVTNEKRWRNEDIQSRQCNSEKGFIVPIAGGSGDEDNNNFYVRRLDYLPVEKGKRVVVSIRGDNFSSQMGVLINGAALRPALGLAQPFIRDDSRTGEETSAELAGEKIRGMFERIDSNQIVLSFEMPADFEGTPIITLVAPGKALDLNRLFNLEINKKNPASLMSGFCNGTIPVLEAPWMFGKRPQTTSLKVEKVELFKPAQDSTKLIALITGAGFKREKTPPRPCLQPANNRTPEMITTIEKIFINGKLFEINEKNKEFEILSSGLIKAEFEAPVDETIKITLMSGDDKLDAPTAKKPGNKPDNEKDPPSANLAYLRIDEVEFKSYEDNVLVVELIGTGFNQKLKPSVNGAELNLNLGELVVISPRRAVLKLIKPEPATTLQLVDEKTNTFARTIIPRSIASAEDDY